MDKHMSTWIITGRGRSKGINQDIKFIKAVTDGFQKKKSMLATLVTFTTACSKTCSK
jgi:hypothetical protein